MRSERGLARARRPGHQGGRATEHAAAEHVVEAVHPGGHPLIGGAVVERDRRDRQHDEALGGDQERELVGAVRGPAVLDHPEPAGGDLLGDPVVEDDHAIGDVLLDPVPGEAVVAAFPGHDGGHAPLFQPAGQPVEFRPDGRVVAERAEQHLDRVQHDPPGADAPDRVVENQEERPEVERAGGDDLGGLDLERDHREQAVPLELVEVEAERAHVQGDLLRGLLEGHQHAGLTVLLGPGDQEFQSQQRLARSRAARHQRYPAPGQPALGDLIQPGDSGRRFLQPGAHRGILRARQHCGAHVHPPPTRACHEYPQRNTRVKTIYS